MKTKNKIFSLIMTVLLIIPAMFFLTACGDNGNSGPGGNSGSHDSSKWFTEAELSAVGLSNLTAPTGLNGEISSSDAWFNDGYSFSQPCDSVDLLQQNAEIYLNYFKTNYNGYFGHISGNYGVKYGENETWYILEQSNSLGDYFGNNPSKLYRFYYVTNHETDKEGYFVKNSVYTFEIRYEFSTSTNQYLFKLFIEKADTSTNGVFSYYYKMK